MRLGDRSPWEKSKSCSFGLSCQKRAGEKTSGASTGNHTQDARDELMSEKVHPSALAVAKRHALEAITLDLHRQSNRWQRPVHGFLEHLSFILHGITYARIREGAHFNPKFVFRRSRKRDSPGMGANGCPA